MDSELYEDAVSKHDKSSVYEEPMKIDDFKTNHTPENGGDDFPNRVQGGQNRTLFEGEGQRQFCCEGPKKCLIF